MCTQTSNVVTPVLCLRLLIMNNVSSLIGINLDNVPDNFSKPNTTTWIVFHGSSFNIPSAVTPHPQCHAECAISTIQ